MCVSEHGELFSYFAGEVSADTRAPIEEFLTTDPEFARMTQRFQTLYEEHAPRLQVDSASGLEMTAFHRARTLMERRNQTFGGAIGFTLGTLFALAMGLFGEAPAPRSFVIAIVFGAVGLRSWISWYATGPRLTSSG